MTLVAAGVRLDGVVGVHCPRLLAGVGVLVVQGRGLYSADIVDSVDIVDIITDTPRYLPGDAEAAAGGGVDSLRCSRRGRTPGCGSAEDAAPAVGAVGVDVAVGDVAVAPCSVWWGRGPAAAWSGS